MGATLIVRVAGMGHPLLPDEGYTWLVASAPTPAAFLARLTGFENTPPLYYLLAGGLPTGSVWFLRLPSLLAGVGVVAVVWAVVRPRFGRGAATVAALAIAVAPYAAAESNNARAYMLADLWLIVCFWAALRLVEASGAAAGAADGEDVGAVRRWWWVYELAAVLAIYSEYDAAATLLPLATGLVLLRRGRRRMTVLLAVLPAVAFLPWLGQFLRSSRDFGVTKAGLGYLTVSPASVRDQLVALFYGRFGQDLSPLGSSVAFVALVALFLVAAVALYRSGPRGRPTLVLAGWAGLGTLVLHAAAALVGIGIFDVGYLTFLLPVCALLIGAACASLAPPRVLLRALALLLCLAGVGLAVQRAREVPDIEVGRITSILRRDQVHTVLTNSAVVDFYFHTDGAILDRPFNLGPGLQDRCGACARAVAVVDDTDVGSGARPGPGAVTDVGHYAVRVLPGS